MNIFKKKLSVPTGEVVQVDAAELWEVEWTSRFSEYSSGTRQEFEIFLNEEDARKFRDSLEAAFKLLKHTSQTRVFLRKRT